MIPWKAAECRQGWRAGGLEDSRAGGQGGVMVEQRVTRFGAHVNVSITDCFLNPNHTTLRSKTPVTSH